MTWSYSGDPSTSSKDAVRFYIQDVDTSEQVMQDEDILFLLVSNSNPRVAAIEGLKTLLMKYSMLADRTVGDTSVKYTQRVSDFVKLIDMLTATTIQDVDIKVGSESTSSITYTGPKILFRKGMFDNG